jgi:hypothetical protein
MGFKINWTPSLKICDEIVHQMFKFIGIQSTGSGRSISYTSDGLDPGFVTIIGSGVTLSFTVFYLF